MSTGDPVVKLVLLGNGSVGKSSLIARFVDNGFTPVYRQTVGLDFFEKKLYFPRDQRLVLQVWDIGGQNLQSKMLSNYLYGANLVLLCYDVTDLQSFQDADDWLRLALEAASSVQTHIYLLGNKIDLLAHRVVSEDKHDAFIRQNKLHGGFLVSAQNGDTILRAVSQAAAIAAHLSLSDNDLAFCDRVVAARVPASDGNEGRTVFADDIEAEDLALERKKRQQAQANGRCHCRVM